MPAWYINGCGDVNKVANQMPQKPGPGLGDGIWIQLSFVQPPKYLGNCENTPHC